MPKYRKVYTLANPENVTEGTTDQRRLFVQEYLALRCVNGAEAARRAGCSDINARQQAWKWLKMEDVQAEIRRYHDEADKITVLRLCEAREELRVIARSDVSDILVDNGEGQLVFRDDIPEDSWRAVKSVTSKRKVKITEFGKDVETEIKLDMHDKPKSVHMMLTTLGELTKKVEHSGKVALADAIRGFMEDTTD